MNPLRVFVVSAVCCLAMQVFAASIAVTNVRKDSDGIKLQMNPGILELEVYSPRIIRVTYTIQNQLPKTASLAVIAKPRPTKWNWRETKDEIILRTDEIQAHVKRATGAVSFFDNAGHLILAENPENARSLTPANFAGIATFRSKEEFLLAPDEAIYGLGQHPNGLMNYCGNVIHLQQRNPTESAVPFLVSSRGYGVLWDNPAVTDVAVGAGLQQVIPSHQLYSETGQPGGLTARYYSDENFATLITNRTDSQVDFDWSTSPPTGLPHDHYSVRWDGFVEARQGGTYTFVTSADDGVRLWIDGRQVIDDWGIHSVSMDTAQVTFAANSRHRIRLEYFQARGEAIINLAWQLPAESPLVTWTSEAADVIDYYFIYGPKLDDVIESYRQLTGPAPMFGKWAWGFWQCKEHYASQQELLDVAQRYRQMQVPLDCVIQDWYYWNPYPWGSHRFDTNRYPDFKGLMQELHAEKVHLIISVWGRFDEGSANWRELEKAGGLYGTEFSNFLVPGKYQYYDAFNSAARRIYWRQISSELFADGIDGWWLDASEPELSSRWGEFQDITTADGPGLKVFNAYPLMHTTGVYQGQRAETSKKRVFILTRSAYAGQQRNAAVTWSGDIRGTWDVFANQIPAGLNFSISGIPYWNTDTGGFFGGDPSDPGYAELFTRWFQFSAFCPMFRVHGTGHPKEMWRFGANTEAILIQYDKLRYHLLPYIYSVSWMVTHDGYTMMRPLVMDFQSDTNVFNIRNQYLFGPALMPCPVTAAGAASRNVYLPSGATWYDFWTGQTYAGGRKYDVAATIDKMPIYVRAGSIIPYGPEIQYAMQTNDPIELRIYRGADGQFTLYEDEGDNYGYEKGEYSTISISWNEAKRTLEIGKRSGSFPGMLKERTFKIVWISDGHGAGVASAEKPDAVVHYNGAAVKISAAQ